MSLAILMYLVKIPFIILLHLTISLLKREVQNSLVGWLLSDFGGGLTLRMIDGGTWADLTSGFDLAVGQDYYLAAAFHLGAGNYAHYVSSRGAIIGLTRAMARELGQFNINVNSIAPGGTQCENADEARIKFCQEPIGRRSIKRVEYPEDLTEGTYSFLTAEMMEHEAGKYTVEVAIRIF